MTRSASASLESFCRLRPTSSLSFSPKNVTSGLMTPQHNPSFIRRSWLPSSVFVDFFADVDTRNLIECFAAVVVAAPVVVESSSSFAIIGFPTTELFLAFLFRGRRHVGTFPDSTSDAMSPDEYVARHLVHVALDNEPCAYTTFSELTPDNCSSESIFWVYILRRVRRRCKFAKK